MLHDSALYKYMIDIDIDTNFNSILSSCFTKEHNHDDDDYDEF